MSLHNVLKKCFKYIQYVLLGCLKVFSWSKDTAHKTDYWTFTQHFIWLNSVGGKKLYVALNVAVFVVPNCDERWSRLVNLVFLKILYTLLNFTVIISKVWVTQVKPWGANTLILLKAREDNEPNWMQKCNIISGI